MTSEKKPISNRCICGFMSNYSTQNLKRYIYSMYNNTQALAAAELQSFAGILQPHFHAHEITLKTNGTWPTQLFFAHPIKLFHFASVSVWPGGRNWGNKMRIWRLFADPELFGSPQRCRILKCVFNFNGTNSFKCSLHT